MNPLATPAIPASNELALQSAPAYPAALPVSAVSWGAILAGATGAAALSLILMMLGTGLGFSVLSPWTYHGVDTVKLSVSAILWLTLTQIFASGLGGYLAGRLRSRWVDAGTDEIYFRDTAHGFLAWGVATLVTAVLLASVIGTIGGSGVQAAAAEMAVSDGSDRNSTAYFVDTLFRKSAAAPAAQIRSPGSASEETATAAEIGSIFMNAVPAATLPPSDVRYVGRLVAQRSGLPQADAEQRVRDVYASFQGAVTNAESEAKSDLEKARKASAKVSLWLFISLLIGAFVASLAAICGGRSRDAV